MKEDNNDVQLLKEEMWSRRMIAKITMLERRITVKEYDILKEIQRNNTREK